MVFHHICQALYDHFAGDLDAGIGPDLVGHVEEDVVEQAADDRMQAAGADVLQLGIQAISAICSRASSSKVSTTSSACSKASYCLVRALRGYLRMR